MAIYKIAKVQNGWILDREDLEGPESYGRVVVEAKTDVDCWEGQVKALVRILNKAFSAYIKSHPTQNGIERYGLKVAYVPGDVESERY